MTDRPHNRAVTLIEMMVVLGIIAVLAGVVVTLTRRVDNQSKDRALDGAFALLNTSLRQYYEFRDEFPSQPVVDHGLALSHVEFMLKELESVPDSRQVLNQLDPGLIKSQAGLPEVRELRDPWGTVLDYIYDHSAGDRFPELISAGPDRQFGTSDDISSKSRKQN